MPTLPVHPAPAPDDAAPRPRQRRISTTVLFEGEREIVIVHHGSEYRLRITKADRLILTK